MFYIILPGLVLIYIILFLLIRRFYIMGTSQGARIDETKRKNELLLVIDIQQLYIKNTPVKRANRCIRNIKRLTGHFEKAHQDIVFIASVRAKTLFSSLFLFDIALRNTESAKIDARLGTANPVVFEKFFADIFYNPDFEMYLTDRGIKRIFITGMAAEVCVNKSANGALNRGYEVFLIKDGIIPIFGNISLNRILRKAENRGAHVLSVDDFLKKNYLN